MHNSEQFLVFNLISKVSYNIKHDSNWLLCFLLHCEPKTGTMKLVVLRWPNDLTQFLVKCVMDFVSSTRLFLLVYISSSGCSVSQNPITFMSNLSTVRSIWLMININSYIMINRVVF